MLRCTPALLYTGLCCFPAVSTERCSRRTLCRDDELHTQCQDFIWDGLTSLENAVEERRCFPQDHPFGFSRLLRSSDLTFRLVLDRLLILQSFTAVKDADGLM